MNNPIEEAPILPSKEVAQGELASEILKLLEISQTGPTIIAAYEKLASSYQESAARELVIDEVLRDPLYFLRHNLGPNKRAFAHLEKAANRLETLSILTGESYMPEDEKPGYRRAHNVFRAFQWGMELGYAIPDPNLKA